MTFAYKTRAEQRLDALETLGRPLTDAESDELRRSLHAVYTRARKFDRELREPRLTEHRAEELKLLGKMRGELARGQRERGL